MDGAIEVSCVFPVLLQYMFTALRDCVPTIKWSRHQESPVVLLDLFDKEVHKYVGCSHCIYIVAVP